MVFISNVSVESCLQFFWIDVILDWHLTAEKIVNWIIAELFSLLFIVKLKLKRHWSIGVLTSQPVVFLILSSIKGDWFRNPVNYPRSPVSWESPLSRPGQTSASSLLSSRSFHLVLTVITVAAPATGFIIQQPGASPIINNNLTCSEWWAMNCVLES